MLTSSQAIRTLDELRTYVNQTLCQREQLEQGAFHMTERILVRGGKPCGIYFCLHGPRAVRFTAIWASDTNTVLFYGADGERYGKTRLVQSPRFASTLPSRSAA
jgi:hypothetical protein